MLLGAFVVAAVWNACGAKPGYELVWADEFDRPGLPDPAKWACEEGFVRNREAQYYATNAGTARVESGRLVIEARKERRLNPHYVEGASDWRRARRTTDYLSASLTTRGKAQWRYGRIEVRARLPHGRGVWPAIWTLGTNIAVRGWPRCGEIDVMEFVGKQPDKIYATVHFAGEDGRHVSRGNKGFSVERPWGAFHVYAIEWTERRIDFFFDGVRCHSFDVDEAGEGTDNPFREPHYLILNLALGGNWGGEIDDTVLPRRFEIDYVRVYRRRKS